MARIKTAFSDSKRPPAGGLAERLADEIKSEQASGQPFIYEQEYSTGKIRALVVWDEWQDRPLDERTATILAAYERAEGATYRDRVALASGLTVPEAVAAGMLPYQIITAHRASDPVTLEQCRQAALDEGATRLMGPNVPQLRFATEEEANACRARLIARLPQSDDVWLITREFAAHEYASADDSAMDRGL